jgi:hypothetical protein
MTYLPNPVKTTDILPPLPPPRHYHGSLYEMCWRGWVSRRGIPLANYLNCRFLCLRGTILGGGSTNVRFTLRCIRYIRTHGLKLLPWTCLQQLQTSFSQCSCVTQGYHGLCYADCYMSISERISTNFCCINCFVLNSRVALH